MLEIEYLNHFTILGVYGASCVNGKLSLTPGALIRNKFTVILLQVYCTYTSKHRMTAVTFW